jgi:hypothetical protein
MNKVKSGYFGASDRNFDVIIWKLRGKTGEGCRALNFSLKKLKTEQVYGT